TRQLLSQSSIDIESLVRSDFAAIHGIAIDRAAVHGKGAAGEPMGIYNIPNVGAVSMGGTITYAKLIDMLTAVANANALTVPGSFAYITTPGIAATLKKTLDFPTASAGRPIWPGTF